VIDPGPSRQFIHKAIFLNLSVTLSALLLLMISVLEKGLIMRIIYVYEINQPKMKVFSKQLDYLRVFLSQVRALDLFGEGVAAYWRVVPAVYLGPFCARTAKIALRKRVVLSSNSVSSILCKYKILNCVQGGPFFATRKTFIQLPMRTSGCPFSKRYTEHSIYSIGYHEKRFSN
jgi:hypothetical protein